MSLPTESSIWDPIIAMILQTVTKKLPLTTALVAEYLKMEYSHLYSTGDSTDSTNIAHQAAQTKIQQRKKLNSPVCSIHSKSNYTNAQYRQQSKESTNDNGNSRKKKRNITPQKPANAAIV